MIKNKKEQRKVSKLVATYKNETKDFETASVSTTTFIKIENSNLHEPVRPNLFHYVEGNEKEATLLIPFMEKEEQKLIIYLFGQDFKNPCKEALHGISMGTFLRKTLPSLRAMIAEYKKTGDLPVMEEKELKTFEKTNKKKKVETSYEKRAPISLDRNLYSYLPNRDKNIIMLVCTCLEESYKKILVSLFGGDYNSNPYSNRSYYLELKELKEKIIPEIILRYDYFVNTGKLDYNKEEFSFKKGYIKNRTIYEYFSEYSTEEIDAVLEKIKDPLYIELIKAKFNGNGESIESKQDLSPSYTKILYNQVLPFIEINLIKNREIKTGISKLSLNSFLNIERRNVFNIYVYFLTYDEDDVTKAISLLKEEEQSKLKLRYGENLKEPVLNDHITILEYYEIICVILPRVESLIKSLINYEELPEISDENKPIALNNRCSKKRNFYDYFIPDIVTEKSKVDEIFSRMNLKYQEEVYKYFNEDFSPKETFHSQKLTKVFGNACTFMRVSLKRLVLKETNSVSLSKRCLKKESFYDYFIPSIVTEKSKVDEIFSRMNLRYQEEVYKYFNEDFSPKEVFYLGSLSKTFRSACAFMRANLKRLSFKSNRKSTQFLKEYFSDYHFGDIVEVINGFKTSRIAVIKKAYGEDYLSAKSSLLTKAENSNLVSSILPAISKKLEAKKENGLKLSESLDEENLEVIPSVLEVSVESSLIKVVKIEDANKKLLDLLYYAVDSKEKSLLTKFNMNEVEKIFRIFSKPIFMEAMRDLTISECVACAHSLGYINGSKEEICSFLGINDGKRNNLVISSIDAFKEAMNRIIENVELVDDKGESFKIKLF